MYPLKRRLMLSALLILLIAALFLLMYITGSGGIVRLHVIANSDSKEDQRVKLLVRDALIECEKRRMELAFDGRSAEKGLMRDADAMLAAARAVLDENGCAYDVKLSIGDYEFPDRVYGDTLYPAGEYRALRVVLGDGKGKNWWCVMFPPLCILELNAGEIDNEAVGFEFRSLIAELISKADTDGGIGKLWERQRG